MAYKKSVKKVKRRVDSVVAHIKASFNNTLVTITDDQGNVLARSSAGKLGFKGSRKGTPFAAGQVGNTLAKEIANWGVRRMEINLQGLGSGRDSAARAFVGAGFHVIKLSDVTPLPHNGCRAPKKRRV